VSMKERTAAAATMAHNFFSSSGNNPRETKAPPPPPPPPMSSHNKNDDNDDDKTGLPPVLPHEKDETVLEAFRYISSVPGKDVRGKLIDCFQLWFRVESTSILDSIKDIIGDLHNASLLMDDIEDNSNLRRGIPVAHKVFGIPATINCSSYAIFLTLEKVHALENPQAMTVFVGELLNLHRGQGQDIFWRDSMTCPTEEQYLGMVADKTGGLFRLAVGLLQAFATRHQTTNFHNVVNNLAKYFQIRDDFINLADEEYMKSKSFCEDLTEGKFSFPILHNIRQDPNDRRLLNILKQRTEDTDVKRYAQGLMKDSGSLTYTRQKCRELMKDIITEIEELGNNQPLINVLQVLDVQLDKFTGETQDARTTDVDET
jgi:geranylgeranyl diphosphate synthase type 3